MELCRKDFWEFCKYYDPEFFAKRRFLKRVADAFTWLMEEYKEGRGRKVSVSMSPRAGKSYSTSLFCVWWLGNFPTVAVMRNTCTGKLYNKFSYAVRKIIRDPRTTNLFPWLILQPDKQNIDGWSLTTAKQVSYFGAGVGGTIIGEGANIAISDDLYSGMSDALSVTIQESVAVWKESDHDSRKETGCPEIFIGTRWTKRDEIGKAIAGGEIDKEITIPALMNVVRNEHERILSGVSFCEAVLTTEEYMKIANKINPMIFEAEYMQNPVEMKGLLFPAGKLNYFAPEEIAKVPVEYKFLPVDPADTGGDNLAAPTCKLMFGNRIYVDHVYYNGYGTDIMIPALIERICAEKYNHVDIESNGAWELFGKAVRDKVWERASGGDVDFRLPKATTHKGTRIFAQSAFILNHFWFLKAGEDENGKPYRDEQYSAFMEALCKYLLQGGNDQEDDAPDSLVMAAEFFGKNFSELW